MESRSFYQVFDVLAVSPGFILHFLIGSTSLSLQGDSLKREIGDKGDSPQSEPLSRCPEQSVRQHFLAPLPGIEFFCPWSYDIL